MGRKKRMSEEQPQIPIIIRPSDNPASRSGLFRLLVIPFAIYCLWMILTALFEGDHRLFLNADPRGIIVYTVFACIITGMILPVYCIRESFITGAVNLFQIGFWPVRRTFYACFRQHFSGTWRWCSFHRLGLISPHPDMPFCSCCRLRSHR